MKKKVIAQYELMKKEGECERLIMYRLCRDNMIDEVVVERILQTNIGSVFAQVFWGVRRTLTNEKKISLALYDDPTNLLDEARGIVLGWRTGKRRAEKIKIMDRNVKERVYEGFATCMMTTDGRTGTSNIFRNYVRDVFRSGK